MKERTTAALVIVSFGLGALMSYAVTDARYPVTVMQSDPCGKCAGVGKTFGQPENQSTFGVVTTDQQLVWLRVR